MPNPTDKKKFSSDITRRFLIAMDNIIGNTENGKVTAGEFGNTVGIAGSNLTRLRTSEGNFVTIEAVGKICHYYNVSPEWLIMDQGEMFKEKINKKDVIQNLKDAVKAVESELSKSKVKHKLKQKTRTM